MFRPSAWKRRRSSLKLEDTCQIGHTILARDALCTARLPRQQLTATNQVGATWPLRGLFQITGSRYLGRAAARSEGRCVAHQGRRRSTAGALIPAAFSALAHGRPACARATRHTPPATQSMRRPCACGICVYSRRFGALEILVHSEWVVTACVSAATAPRHDDRQLGGG